MNDLTAVPVGIVINLLSEFLIVVVGVLFASFVKNRYDNFRYGHWQVIVKERSGAEHTREVSPKKAKQILDVPEDKSVFLKGIVGAWEHLNCDLIVDGPKLGLLKEDKANRRFTIDLSKNPPPARHADKSQSDIY